MKTKILANIIYYFIRLLNLTYRYQFIGLENKNGLKEINKNYIYALWHQNLIGSIFSHIGEHFTMVISESSDGELVSLTCKKFGHKPARGSSTRGGKKALLEMVRNINQGTPGAISVDGPTGPVYKVKLGIIEIAKITKTPILPLSPYSNSFWTLKKSWDQFRIPKPFSKIVVVIGTPIFIDEHSPRENFENYAQLIKEQLHAGETLAQKTLNR